MTRGIGVPAKESGISKLDESNIVSLFGYTPEQILRFIYEHEERESGMKGEDKGVYHGHPRFYELLDMMRDIHDRKSHDYAGDKTDPLKNFRLCENQGIPAWQGVLVRLSDKLSRLQAFARQGELKVKDESVVDTFLDNAVYSLLGLILFEETLEKIEPEEKQYEILPGIGHTPDGRECKLAKEVER